MKVAIASKRLNAFFLQNNVLAQILWRVTRDCFVNLVRITAFCALRLAEVLCNSKRSAT